MIQYLLILSSILIAAAPTTREGSDAAAVRRDIATLKQELEAGDGAVAATLVSDALLQHYDEARKVALDSKGVDLESLPQMQLLLVFQLRYLADAKTLRQMKSGADVFAWGVENGLLKRDTVRAFELREVKVEENQARATLLRSGEPVDDMSFHFERKDDGRWRLQLEKMFRPLESQFAKVREEAKKTKVELAIFLMERTYGQTIPREILDGPLVK